MNKIWLIIKREYLSRVRNKSFIITTLLAPLSLILLFGLQFFILTQTTDKKSILIKDDSGLFSEASGEHVRIKLKDDAGLFFKGSNLDLEELQSGYAEMGYDGVLHIPSVSNMQNIPSPTYYSDRLLGMASRMSLENKLENVVENIKIEEAGLDKNMLERLKASITIREKTGGEEGAEASSLIASGVSFILGFIMYMSIIIYGTLVMRGVLEEKTNRIVEVILSSVKPFKLMIGKIVGIGAVGLTQFVIWIITAGLLYVAAGFLMTMMMDPETLQQMANGSAGMGGASPPMDADEMQVKFAQMMDKLQSVNWGFLAVAFVFYYLGGFFFYSSLFAAVGSALGEDSSSSDSQALVMPITVPVIISFFILMAIIDNPNGGLAFWSSIIPFSSPIIMPARIAFGLSPFSIDFFLSVLCLVGGFVFTTWLAAKIYRTGILMRGKKVGVKEMVKWLRY